MASVRLTKQRSPASPGFFVSADVSMNKLVGLFAFVIFQIAAKLANMPRGGDRPSIKDSNFETANLHNRKQISQTQAAEMLNVSPRLVADAKKIIDERPELAEKKPVTATLPAKQDTKLSN